VQARAVVAGLDALEDRQTGRPWGSIAKEPFRGPRVSAGSATRATGASLFECPSVCVTRSRHRDGASRARSGAWTLAEDLRASTFPVGIEGTPLDLLAEVLADLQSDPVRLMEGEPLCER